MSNVPTNLIPTRITGLPEYDGTSTLGYIPYILDGRTYKVQFGQIAAVGAVPSTRVIAAGTGLAGGGDLSENRVISIANGGVGFDQLSASGVIAGSYGSGSAIPVLTVDAKGRVTDASTTPLVITGYVPDSRLISSGAGLLGGGSLASNRTLSVDFSSATPQALGSATAGVSTAAARGDHVHPAVNLSDTNQTQGALPLGRGGTGDALSPVAGAVVYSTGTKLALADPGDPGQVFTSNGAGEPYWRTISGTGTVTNVSVVTANGFGGTVAFADTTPQITLSTTVNGMAKGDGVSLLAAAPGVDYVAPSAYISSGLTMATSRILGRTDLGTGEAQEITVGTGLSLSAGSLVNSAPDQTVTLTGGTAISISGTYPSFTITNTAPDQVVSLTASTGMSVSGTYPSFTLTNTAPDQVVSLTGAGTTVVTGTYPNFTITSNDQYVGTVTSVAASGGSTGLTFSGSPITTSGTLTLGGTLAVASGGTGQTSYTDGQLLIGNSTGNTLTKSTLTAGSGVSISNGNGSITISATGTGGTVTSINASGGSTGLTFSGGPVTSSGTLTLGGTLGIGSGGTGATTAGAARTALGAAASGANTDITSIALTSGTILNAPVNGTDIANKTYVDSISAGINFHQAVRLASAAALPAYTYNNGSSGVGATITANANGALTLDGVATAASDRVLIKNEVSGNAPYNGVYVVTQTGNGSTPFILTRATDYNTAGTGVNQIDAGDFFLVTAGSTQANTSWVQQTPLPIVVGTTAIVFSQFGAPITYSAGTGLTLAGTVFSIANTGVTASTYGSASQVPVLAVNAQGQITSASSSSIAIAASQVTSGVLAVAQGGTGQSSYTDGQLLIGNSTGNTLTKATLTAGSGVSISNGGGSITISATGAGGTVTSVDASGGTTGLTFSGGPITSSGTLTLAGTLSVANGGTGATSLSSGYVLKGNGTSAVSSSIIYDNGTNVGIGTTSSTARLASQANSGNYLLDLINGSETGFALRTYNHGSASAPGLVFTQGIYYGTTENAAIKFYRGGGGTGGYLGFTVTDGTERLSINASGNVTANVDIRAPIFYDSNNTAFYVDPTSNSHLLELRIGTSAGDTNQTGIIKEAGATYGLGLFTWGDVAPIRIGGGSVTFAKEGGAAISVTSVGDFRAPIFYDSNDTSYYCDPGNNSVFLNVQYGVNYTSAGGGGRLVVSPGSPYSLRQDFGSDNTGWRYGIAKNVSGTATVLFYVQDTGPVVATGDMRAPIFYDSDNTGYYVDPASTSNLGQINFGDSTKFIRGGASGQIILGAGSASDAYIQVGGSYYPIWNSGNFTPGNYMPISGGTFTGAVGFAGNVYNTVGGAKFFANSGNINYLYAATSGLYVQNATDTANILSLTNGGSLTASADMRAPYYYDSNDTAYYVDPASTSRLGTLWVSYGQYAGQIYVGGLSPGVALNINFDQVWTATGNLHFQYSSAGNIDMCYGGGYAFSRTSFRAPIFYDSDNTGYYCDPSGTSALTYVTASDVTSTNFRATNAFYVNGYSYYLNSTNGGWYSNARIQSEVDMRAPIFYDSNNTAYYADPASTSRLNALSLDTVAVTSGITGLTSAPITTQYANAGTTNTWYPMTYQRAQHSGGYVTHLNTGLFKNTSGWGSAATGWYAAIGGNDSYPTQAWYLTYDAYIQNSLGYVLTSGSFRAPIFYDSDNTAYYLDAASTGTALSTNGILIAGTGTSGGVQNRTFAAGRNRIWSFANADTYGLSYFQGGPDYIGLHFGTATQAASQFWVSDGGTAQASGSMRAPIFYDSNDTGYYVDPASTSSALITAGNGTFGSTTPLARITARNVTSGVTPADSASIVLSNRSTAINGTLAGGIFMDTYRDVRDPHYAGGIWFTRNQEVSNLSSSSDIVFGAMISWDSGLPTERMRVYGSGGYVEATNSFRAPIFYDSNNTGYYTNPADESVLNTLTLFGELNLSASGINYIDHTGTIYFRNQSGYATSATLTTGGNFTATGNVTAYSDARLKEDVETIGNALDLIGKMRGVTYTRKDTGSKGVGVIAQEMQEVIPQVVEESAEGTLSVAYGNLVGVLIEAVKELTARVAELEGK